MASKLDYLKRYMSTEDCEGGGKAKKKVRRKKVKGMVIVDEDLTARSAAFGGDSDGDQPIVVVETQDTSPPRRRQHKKQGRSSDSGDGGDASPPRKRRQQMQDTRTATVFRDKKTGKKMDIALEKKKKREEEDVKAAELEKQMQWGRGLVQKQQTADKVDDMLHEMSKPLARYRDDTDLDRMLRDEDREGDPMLAFMKKKKTKVDPTKPVRPVWQGPFPPNRYNIRPGHRWDGVDRSNGFEKKCFEMKARQKATATEAYQWSVEDM
eukprot:scpid67832/ scgid5970/ BUD13 homolog